VGSNPTLSARNISDCGFRIADLKNGLLTIAAQRFLSIALKSEIRNSQSEILPGRGARVVELAALEML
jgi:hypothetical protein